MTSTEPAEHKSAPASVWTFSTYFAQGFPYSVVINLVDQFFVAQGASLKEVSLTSLFHLPWNLKALVGPFFDAYGTKRKWLVGLELLLSVALFVFALTSTLGDVLIASSIVFIVLGCLSAMHDISIDGLYLEGLSKTDQERLIGWRAPPWRLASLMVTGPVGILCGEFGWFVGGLVLTAIMLVLFVFHMLFLPRTEVQKRPISDLFRAMLSLRFVVIALGIAGVIASARAALLSAPFASLKALGSDQFPGAAEIVSKWSAADWIGLGILLALVVLGVLLPRILKKIEKSASLYAKSYAAFLAQPYATRILAYIVLFRVGESFLMKMKTPFFMKELGLSQSEYSLANGTIGFIAGLAAPVVGGMLIAKLGFQRCVWPFILAQNGLHLVFCFAALFTPEILAADPHTRFAVVTVVIVIEMIGAGLGTAAFMVYIIRCPVTEHKAAHMALLTSLMSIAFTLAGVFSGYLADAIGFPAYFAFTFIVTIPGMVLTFFVPHLKERGAPPMFAR